MESESCQSSRSLTDKVLCVPTCEWIIKVKTGGVGADNFPKGAVGFSHREWKCSDEVWAKMTYYTISFFSLFPAMTKNCRKLLQCVNFEFGAWECMYIRYLLSIHEFSIRYLKSSQNTISTWKWWNYSYFIQLGVFTVKNCLSGSQCVGTKRAGKVSQLCGILELMTLNSKSFFFHSFLITSIVITICHKHKSSTQ